MPTLFSFHNYRIRIYFGDHGTPHVHLIGREVEASIAIETGDVIIGNAPAKALATAREWIYANQEMLLGMWRK